MHSHVCPLHLIVGRPLVELPDLHGKDLEHYWSIAGEEHRFDAVAVRGAPDVGPLAIESLVHRRSQARDVVRTGEVRLLGHQKPFHIDATWLFRQSAEDVTVRRAPEYLLPGEPEEESLSPLHLHIIEPSEDDVRPHPSWIARGTYCGVQGRHVLEAVLGAFDDGDVAVR